MFCNLFSTDRGNSAFLNLLLTLNANGFLLFERYMSQEIHKNNLKILKNSGQASGIPANSFSSSRQMVKDSKDDFSRPADSGRQENNWESGIPHNSTAYEWAPEQWAALRTAIFLNDRSVLDEVSFDIVQNIVYPFSDVCFKPGEHAISTEFYNLCSVAMVTLRLEEIRYILQKYGESEWTKIALESVRRDVNFVDL